MPTLEARIQEMHQRHLKEWDEKNVSTIPEIVVWCSRCESRIFGRVIKEPRNGKPTCPQCKKNDQNKRNFRYREKEKERIRSLLVRFPGFTKNDWVIE